MTVGILGMAFKGSSDDIRSSLAYKLKRVLMSTAAAVRCTDPFVTVDESLIPLGELVESCDLLIIGAPHPEYADLTTSKPVVDIWGLRGEGVQI
jgi:UDP-N-acetyl-D-mannosaminuronic acid dehydrogenase